MRNERIGTGQTGQTSPTLRGRANGEANNSSTNNSSTNNSSTRLYTFDLQTANRAPLYFLSRIIELSNFLFIIEFSRIREYEMASHFVLPARQGLVVWLFGRLVVWLR